MKKVNISISKEELRKKLDIKDGAPGKDGKDGKDADITEAVNAAVSAVKPLIPKIEDIEKNLPKLGEPIRDALELLQDDERLDKKAIKGLDDYDEIKNLAKQPRGGGASVYTIWQEIDTADSNSFEKISKNLKSYPATLSYSGSTLTSIAYTTPSGTVTKTLSYSGGNLSTVVLSGAIPSGISTTKTLSYTGSNLTGVAYS